MCATTGKQYHSFTQVSATTGHEFVHSIGLGHAWEKSGDLMCSKEGDTWTCNRWASEQKEPSDFDIGALVKLYGSDGWEKKNNLKINLRNDYVFTADEFLNGKISGTSTNSNNYPPVQPPVQPPPTTHLTIFSNEEFYKIGDTVKVQGTALSNISNISFKVVDPNGDLVKMFQADISDNKTFQTSFKIEKQFFPLAGGYEIIAWQSRESQDMDSIPITIGIKGVETIKKAGVPNWIKSNAEWWAEGAIDDSAFTQGIQFLIKEKIMNVESKSQSSAESKEIPSWIKNNAKWWADGSIDEGSFLAGIEYLVKEGIVKVN